MVPLSMQGFYHLNLIEDEGVLILNRLNPYPLVPERSLLHIHCRESVFTLDQQVS